MKKKVISFLLAFTLLFTVSGSAFAVDLDTAIPTDAECHETTLSYEGEMIPIKYYMEDNSVIYAEIGDSIAQYIDGDIYLDGKLVATATTTVVSAPENVDRRTGWLYSDSCPYGFEPSDFNIFVESRNHNITFYETVATISRDAIIAAILAICPFDDVAGGQAVFMDVAESIFEGIVGYWMEPKVYAREDVYKMDILGNYMHKNAFNFYSDSAHSDWIGYALAYSSWA